MNRDLNSLARIVPILALALLAGPVLPAQSQPSLRGTVTDPSGANVPNALVQLRGATGEKRTRTATDGTYNFAPLAPGQYQIRVIAKGFSVSEFKSYELAAPQTLDVQLTIEEATQVMNVEAEADRVSTDPTANGNALVLGTKELDALSDDPDELQQQLQAMAGPAAGPNGGQIYIDGFSGGNMPPKSSIREVRINSNPFSPEYDRPGFGRIEILTRPGSDHLRGQAFFQFNNQNFNSRSPLLASALPDYSQKFYGLNLSGPIRHNKASFGLDVERRNINENAFINATILDDNLLPQSLSTAIVTPQIRTTISPRLDLAINPNNTLVMRYQATRSEAQKEGVSDFSLASRAYDQKSNSHSFQLTETAVLGVKAVNETRFQFMRFNSAANSDNSLPALNVQGAFSSGPSQIGNSGSNTKSWELTNLTTFNHSRHTFKWGARLRQSFLDDTSVSNFGGTFSFFGGSGPALDAAGLPIAGTSIQLTALERYRRTLYYQRLGYDAAFISAAGGGASQFALSAGTPLSSVSQFDLGLFFNDDFKLRSNLTLSYGIRYEAQTNLSDLSNFSPRVGLAWGVDARNGKAAKTVLRAGFGTFYDRLAAASTLSSMRYNGVLQQSYLISNPTFFPTVPSAAELAAYRQPQQLQLLDSSFQAPRTYQWSLGVDRQVNRYLRFSANYIGSRGVHLDRQRNINTPINGVYPFGDSQLRILTESTGFNRTNMLMINPTVNYKKLTLFGFYGYSHGKSDSDGMPADPYNLRAEWGPSGFGDIRHRLMLGSNFTLPFKVSLSPFIQISSGSPYNITTGRDALLSGYTTQRPSLMTGYTAAQCTGASLVYSASYGCFNLNPDPGTSISRNYGRGPGSVNLNLRLGRTWSFGRKGESGMADSGGPGPGGPGGPGGGGRGPGGPGGGGPGGPGGPGGGGPGGMFGGANSGMKYNLTLSAMAHNVLNHANYAAPSGDLSSPYFGISRSLAGMGPFGGSSTYQRKIDFQLRFQF